MSRPMWVPALLRVSFPYRSLAAKMTRVPLVGRLIEKALFEGDDIMILPPDGAIRVGEPVEGEGGMPVPSQVVEHFIRSAGHIWIMDSCICRQASGCEDYPHDLGCIFLGEASTRINRKLGRPATTGEALEHLAKCRDAGLYQLVGRNKLDTVWLGATPGDRLLTICNCCTCCCLWKVLPDMSRGIADKLTAMPGVKVVVGEGCDGCGTCVEAPCLTGAISIVDGRAVVGELCRGCGRCALVCPNGAMTVVVEDGRFIQRAIDRIGPLVDIS